MATRGRGRPRLPERTEERIPALRARHHWPAKLLAAGLTRNEVAFKTGYSAQTITNLTTKNPAFAQLVSDYQNDPSVRDAQGLSELETLRTISMRNTIRSALQFEERLNHWDERDEPMPVSEAARIFELSADRIGFGKHSTQTVVHDFATQLEQRRSARKTITIDVASKPQLLPPATSKGEDALTPPSSPDSFQPANGPPIQAPHSCELQRSPAGPPPGAGHEGESPAASSPPRLRRNF